MRFRCGTDPLKTPEVRVGNEGKQCAGEPQQQVELQVVVPARPPGDGKAAVGDELRHGAGADDTTDELRSMGLGQELQLQRRVDGFEVVEADRHHERRAQDARQARIGPGQSHADAEDDQACVGHHLLAQDQQPEDRGEGQKARDLAHGLGEAGLEPAKARHLDGVVVQQRIPAGKAQPVDEMQSPQKLDGRLGRRSGAAGGGIGHSGSPIFKRPHAVSNWTGRQWAIQQGRPCLSHNPGAALHQ